MLMFFGYVHADDILPKNDSTMKEDGGGVDPTSENVKRLHLYSSANDNIVTFSQPTRNCVLYVYNEDDDLEYTAAIPDGTVTFVLPSTISGIHGVLIVAKSGSFAGIINL